MVTRIGSCKSSTVIYGPSGVGKTGQVGGFAKMVYKRTGKITRVYTAEPGGLDTIGHLVESGLIEVCDLSPRTSFFEAMELAVRGWWPKDVSNPESEMVPPTPETWEKVGGHAFEGGTAFGDCGLEELRRLGAMNAITGAEKPPQQFTSGKLRIAGANQTYYGICQGRLKKGIDDSQRVPVHVLWTCRELKAQDNDTKQNIFGPQLVGAAKTPDVPGWFGNCIHLDMRLDSNGKPVRRAFFKNHFVAEIDKNVPFLAKLRIPPEMDSQMEESVLLGADLLTLTWLFDKMDLLRTKAKEMLLAQQAATTKQVV